MLAQCCSQIEQKGSNCGPQRHSFTHQCVFPVFLLLQMVRRVSFNRAKQSVESTRRQARGPARDLVPLHVKLTLQASSYQLCPISWASKRMKSYQMWLCKKKKAGQECFIITHKTKTLVPVIHFHCTIARSTHQNVLFVPQPNRPCMISFVFSQIIIMFGDTFD